MMKKVYTVFLGLLLSGASYAQIPYAPTSSTADDAARERALRELAKEVAKEALKEEANKSKSTSECPPPVTPSKKKPDCVTPKKKPTPKPKPAPKPAPAPAPEVKCPEQKPCPKCEPVVKTVEKEKVVYRDRTVTIDNAPKNTLSILVGVGPHGLVTDYYETRDRMDEYAVRKEKDKAIGGVIGLDYKYRISPSYSVGGMVLSNETVMASGGIHW